MRPVIVKKRGERNGLLLDLLVPLARSTLPWFGVLSFERRSGKGKGCIAAGAGPAGRCWGLCVSGHWAALGFAGEAFRGR